MVRDLWEGVGESGENDALMVSVAELSRESGVPAPEIVGLSQEHPEELPSVTLGGQRFFPRGVVPVLRALHERERGERGLHTGGGGIRSMARVRREVEEAERKRAEADEQGASSPAAGAMGSGRSPEKASEGGGEVASEGGAGADLPDEEVADAAVRLARLEERTRSLTGEIGDVLVESRVADVVELRLLDEDWGE